MRLLLVNYEYPPIGGGAAGASQQIGRALVRLGHEVTMLTAGIGDAVGRDDDQGVLVERLAVRRRHVAQSGIVEMGSFLAAAWRRAPHLARERSIEGTIAFFSVPCGPVALRLRRRAGIPYVVSLRGGDVPGLDRRAGSAHRIVAPVRRRVLRSALAVVANSEGLAAGSRRADPVPVLVIPNGVDTERFAPRGTPPDSRAPFRFLFCGRFQPQKSLPLLLRAFAAARAASGRDVVLHLVGSGPDEAEARALARSLGVEDRVTWSPWADRESIAAVYRDADCFVNASTYEGMPNTVLEAMSSGLPVVASRIAGHAGLVEDGVTGLTFDLAQIDEFTACLRRIAEEPGLAAAAGAAGRARAVRDFAWESTARAYADLFAGDAEVGR